MKKEDKEDKGKEIEEDNIINNKEDIDNDNNNNDIKIKRTISQEEKGMLEEVQKRKISEEKKIIDLNDYKFKQFDKLLTNKVFMKYLTKSYIIKCIFQELFTFLLNNFHWVCYIVMILNHIMTASFLTLFYP